MYIYLSIYLHYKFVWLAALIEKKKQRRDWRWILIIDDVLKVELTVTFLQMLKERFFICSMMTSSQPRKTRTRKAYSMTSLAARWDLERTQGLYDYNKRPKRIVSLRKKFKKEKKNTTVTVFFIFNRTNSKKCSGISSMTCCYSAALRRYQVPQIFSAFRKKERVRHTSIHT